MEGSAGEVVRQYLSDSASINREAPEDRTVWIEKISVLNEEGKEANQFNSGEICSIIINLQSHVNEEGLSLEIDFMDEENRSVFYTSSERMGCGTFSMSPGGSRTFRFDTHLHLAGGNFLLIIKIKKYRIQKTYDTLFPATIIFVKPENGIKGIANLHPVFKEI
jgi:hypothetical protein